MGEGGTHKKPRSKEEQSPDQGGGGASRGWGSEMRKTGDSKAAPH